MSPNLKSALDTFARAQVFTEQRILVDETRWQRAVCPEKFDETQLLREAAWVILCSGFREAIVRRVFDRISLCFLDWESACEIVEASDQCISAARCVLNNSRKLFAIVTVAQRIEREGFSGLKLRVLDDPILVLQEFSYIGPITAFHLAKNLGFEVAKPDRHLVRLAATHGYPNAQALCEDISRVTGETVRVVDLMLWRYAAGWNMASSS